MADKSQKSVDFGDMEVDGDLASELERNEDADDTSDLPPTLIVTNISDIVFSNVTAKKDFETLFQDFDENAHFQYLKSFRRALIHFSSSLHAAKARIHLDETDFYGRLIKCYFAQPRSENKNEDHLLPPPLEKQFLISPPASPPIGWESMREAEPVINYDLLRAISNLGPGQAHEIHPPSENKPAIIVHICEDLGIESDIGPKPKIEHTKCPERK